MIPPVNRSAYPVLAIASLVLVTVGCQSSLPRYPAMSIEQSLSVMRERNKPITTLSASCRIILTDEQDRSVQLNGALVAARDGQLRLRAWKLTQPVFDLTLNAKGGWLWEPQARLSGGAAASVQERAANDAGGFAHFTFFWSMVTGDFDAQWSGHKEEDDLLSVRQVSAGEVAFHCAISTPTLTVTSCSVAAGGNEPEADIKLSGYRCDGSYVLPTQIEASAQGRQFTILFDDLDINEELSPLVFVPPSDAVSLP